MLTDNCIVTQPIRVLPKMLTSKLFMVARSPTSQHLYSPFSAKLIDVNSNDVILPPREWTDIVFEFTNSDCNLLLMAIVFLGSIFSQIRYEPGARGTVQSRVTELPSTAGMILLITWAVIHGRKHTASMARKTVNNMALEINVHRYYHVPNKES